MNTKALEQLLVKSFDDHKLSTSEKHDLKSLLVAFKNEPSKLSFIRNRAFDLVANHYRAEQGDHIEALKWLENVVKSIDQMRSNKIIENSAYFSPGKQCAQKIIALLNRAKARIEICVFTISDDNISRAILAAHQRGVAVRILSDNDKANDLGSDIYSLCENGIQVKIDTSPSHMHHKFAIIDRNTLINGSFNWTRSASNYNQENIVVTNEPGLIEDFAAVFDKLWGQCQKP